jgi:hypothetical protein
MGAEKLTEAVDRLTEEVIALHTILERFHTTLEWGLNNDRFRAGEPSEEEPNLKAMVFDLHEKVQILALAVDEIRQVPKKQQRPFDDD